MHMYREVHASFHSYITANKEITPSQIIHNTFLFCFHCLQVSPHTVHVHVARPNVPTYIHTCTYVYMYTHTYLQTIPKVIVMRRECSGYHLQTTRIQGPLTVSFAMPKYTTTFMHAWPLERKTAGETARELRGLISKLAFTHHPLSPIILKLQELLYSTCRRTHVHPSTKDSYICQLHKQTLKIYTIYRDTENLTGVQQADFLSGQSCTQACVLYNGLCYTYQAPTAAVS